MTYSEDISAAVATMQKGGVILYPTDTIWGIGADATQEDAVQKIFKIKKRAESRSMIILLSDEEQIQEYSSGYNSRIDSILKEATKPTTVIYPGAKNLAPGLIHTDGTIGIRIVKDAFCKAMIESLGKPLVSTSANLSGKPSAGIFKNIDPKIKKSADYIVAHRRNDDAQNSASSIIRLHENGFIEILRP